MRTFRNASNPRHETLVPKTLPLVVDRLEHDRVDVASDLVAGLVDDDAETLSLEHGSGLVADDLVVVHEVGSTGPFEVEVRFAHHGKGSEEIERIAAGHRHEDKPALAFAAWNRPEGLDPGSVELEHCGPPHGPDQSRIWQFISFLCHCVSRCLLA